jgi:hypothetical protein
MMKVELLVSRAGTNFTQSVGEVIEVSDDEGKRLLDSNQAKTVGGKSPSRLPVVESAARKAPKKRSKKVIDE